MAKWCSKGRGGGTHHTPPVLPLQHFSLGLVRSLSLSLPPPSPTSLYLPFSLDYFSIVCVFFSLSFFLFFLFFFYRTSFWILSMLPPRMSVFFPKGTRSFLIGTTHFFFVLFLFFFRHSSLSMMLLPLSFLTGTRFRHCHKHLSQGDGEGEKDSLIPIPYPPTQQWRHRVRFMEGTKNIANT